MHTMQLNSLMNGELFEKRYRFVFMISSLSHPKFDSKETDWVGSQIFEIEENSFTVPTN